jgi:hypothetical protein
MTSDKPRPRWFFLVTPPWLAWHAFAVFAAWGMLWLGDWQFHRAIGGNALSWAYTFEWPIFTAFGVIFWAKTIIDEWREPGGAAKMTHSMRAAGLLPHPDDALGLPGAAHTPALTDDEADQDPELAAYNDYLAKLNRRPAAG